MPAVRGLKVKRGDRGEETPRFSTMTTVGIEGPGPNRKRDLV
jgi:hypothetical protein